MKETVNNLVYEGIIFWKEIECNHGLFQEREKEESLFAVSFFF